LVQYLLNQALIDLELPSLLIPPQIHVDAGAVLYILSEEDGPEACFDTWSENLGGFSLPLSLPPSLTPAALLW
jgi:hypothetical protein